MGGEIPPPLPARKPKLFSITKVVPPLPPPPRDYPGSTENLLDNNANGAATLPTHHSSYSLDPGGWHIGQSDAMTHSSMSQSSSYSETLPQSSSFAEKMSISQSGSSPYLEQLSQSRSFSETLPHNMPMLSLLNGGAKSCMESNETLDLIETTDKVEQGPILTMNGNNKPQVPPRESKYIVCVPKPTL